jgi:hypothetical protein
VKYLSFCGGLGAGLLLLPPGPGGGAAARPGRGLREILANGAVEAVLRRERRRGQVLLDVAVGEVVDLVADGGDAGQRCGAGQPDVAVDGVSADAVGGGKRLLRRHCLLSTRVWRSGEREGGREGGGECCSGRKIRRDRGKGIHIHVIHMSPLRLFQSSYMIRICSLSSQHYNL